MIIEIDGGQHAESQVDNVRDNWIKGQGFKILRFWNNEVLENREGVLETIVKNLNSPFPNPSHQGRGTI